MIYLILAVIVLALVGFFSVKSCISLRKQLKETVRVSEQIVAAEIKKGTIKEKHNEIENNIIDDPNADHNVLPVDSSKEHNHGFRDPCTENCPAFNRK